MFLWILILFLFTLSISIDPLLSILFTLITIGLLLFIWSLSEIFMLFLEECGEMAKAARKTQNIKSDKNSEQFHLDHEIADVFIYLLDICNHYNIDLEKSFRDKEEINKKRFWE